MTTVSIPHALSQIADRFTKAIVDLPFRRANGMRLSGRRERMFRIETSDVRRAVPAACYAVDR